MMPLTAGGPRNWMPHFWVDRVVFVVFVAAAYLTLPGVAIGALSVAVDAVRGLLLDAGGWLLVAPVVLDLTSAYMHVTYVLGRTREHGQAGLSWLYYFAYCVIGLGVAWWWRVVVLLGLTAFHAACQYYIPRHINAKLGWRDGEGETATPQA